jgi:pimeloyl-ACP methyl ester carboxylesterase
MDAIMDQREATSPRCRRSAARRGRRFRLENPDHVAIVIHNYRWRLGLAAGEPHYDEVERRLAAAPAIAVPAITLEGDANGAPHADASAYAGKFTGQYAHRVIAGGVGHNLPQEAPHAFAQAVIDVDGF